MVGIVSEQRRLAERFRALHEGPAFVIPNPWDEGSAKLLAGLGFEALATTSSGFAYALGRDDGSVELGEMETHVAAIGAAAGLPVSVDLENGYGPRPEDAARAIERVAAAGAVGGSIEDWDRDESRLYGLDEALERLGAALEAARSLDFPFTLTARAENHIRDNRDIDDTIARLKAYEEAGADVIYAPGLGLEEVRAVRAETTKPINVLARPDLTVAEIADAGGQRVSLGGALTWVGVAAVGRAAERVRDGDLSVLDEGRAASRYMGD
jgi:2-methylisocitrate lyase-like PEP mutase family enzyme